MRNIEGKGEKKEYGDDDDSDGKRLVMVRINQLENYLRINGNVP